MLSYNQFKGTIQKTPHLIKRGDTTMKRTIDEINNLLAELADYTRMATELETAMDQIRTQLKNHMSEQNITELMGLHGEKVYWKEIVSRRLNTQLLKKENTEIYERYLKDSVSKPFKFYC